ncbi:MAG: O-acetyl-ADP-ribose deacetylase [Chitinophagaceae bacterium]|nr:MAG: O-acetyl-ADP-ribose deacetylase [Chitinophagaceae bacterium]
MDVKSRIRIVQGDITKVSVDAIVNAANTSLLGGGGVDGAIHRAGGPQILEECKAIVLRQGGCATGEAVVTGAGNLPAKWVIHTVGPVWNGGHKGEREKLSACYRNSLRLAEQHGARTVAFPNISTGVYRFPKADAAAIAWNTVALFLAATDAIDEVQFVCFDEENYGLLLEAARTAEQ